MAFNPGISFFISFTDLDATPTNQCIFYTLKGARCRHRCSRRDVEQRDLLCKIIDTSIDDNSLLQAFEEYAVLNCCRNARHQDRIRDLGLSRPLAKRWQVEMQAVAPLPSPRNLHEKTQHHLLKTIKIEEQATPHMPTTLRPPVDCAAGLNARHNSRASEVEHNKTGPLHVSTCKDPTTFPVQGSKARARYNLRSFTGQQVVDSKEEPASGIDDPAPTEFRPHKACPGPQDCVYHKLLKPLKGRDLDIGAIYAFSRKSSPGHIKIGWTAVSVSERLRSWSKCGYQPMLLRKFEDVPHAQRVETLIHHELIQEWRREVQCKASHCLKSHQEWFEVDEERCLKVIQGWTDFMTRVEPYDAAGMLKGKWKEHVGLLTRKGVEVTAELVLQKHKEWSTIPPIYGQAAEPTTLPSNKSFSSASKPKLGAPESMSKSQSPHKYSISAEDEIRILLTELRADMIELCSRIDAKPNTYQQTSTAPLQKHTELIAAAA